MDDEPSEVEHKHQAHKVLMEGGGWLGVVYREQVKRVRVLSAAVSSATGDCDLYRDERDELQKKLNEHN